MNTATTEISTQIPLTHQEIHFLEKKRKTALMLMLTYAGLPLAGFALYAAGLPITLIYLAIISLIFAFFIFKEARIFRRTGSDLRGSHKIMFEAEIEDYKQIDQTDRDGVITGSKYFFVVRGGEKYEVGGDRFYKFGRGDTVKITVAPASKYAFDIEKIRGAERSREPHSTLSFTSPLS